MLIALLPGDGIGPEVMAEAARVLRAFGRFELATGLLGGAAMEAPVLRLEGIVEAKYQPCEAITLQPLRAGYTLLARSPGGPPTWFFAPHKKAAQP